MKEFVGLRTKTYAYLADNDNEHKKAKGTKKCVTKKNLMFKYYLDCSLNDEAILKSQQRLKSVHDNVYIKQINKIALSSNCGKRLERFDKITTYP